MSRSHSSASPARCATPGAGATMFMADMSCARPVSRCCVECSWSSRLHWLGPLLDPAHESGPGHTNRAPEPYYWKLSPLHHSKGIRARGVQYVSDLSTAQ